MTTNPPAFDPADDLFDLEADELLRELEYDRNEERGLDRWRGLDE